MIGINLKLMSNVACISSTKTTMNDEKKSGNSKLPTLKVYKLRVINYSFQYTCFRILG